MDAGEIKLISIRQAAEMFGVSPKTLRRWCDMGLVPFMTTPCDQHRFKESDIRSILESRYVPAR